MLLTVMVFEIIAVDFVRRVYSNVVGRHIVIFIADECSCLVLIDDVQRIDDVEAAVLMLLLLLSRGADGDDSLRINATNSLS